MYKFRPQHIPLVNPLDNLALITAESDYFSKPSLKSDDPVYSFTDEAQICLESSFLGSTREPSRINSSQLKSESKLAIEVNRPASLQVDFLNASGEQMVLSPLLGKRLRN